MSVALSAPRYAVYFVPARESALYRFGSAVLGRDLYDGAEVAFAEGAPADWYDCSEEPRRYGFHATLAAPFRLAAGTTIEDVQSTLGLVAARHAAFDLGFLEVRNLGRFIALVPADAPGALQELADDCVRSFARFRAPLSPAERARRLAAPLSEAERLHLETWGYPYVFDRFRFHMTLSGALPDDRVASVRAWLASQWRASDGEACVRIDRLALCEQDPASGLFRVLQVEMLFSSEKSVAR